MGNKRRYLVEGGEKNMMNLMKFNFWEGKKTYILSVLLVMYAIGGFFTGNLELKEALELLGLGGIATTLRKAM